MQREPSAYIAGLVADAPPFTDHQLDVLTRMLSPDAEQAPGQEPGAVHEAIPDRQAGGVARGR